MRRRPLLVGVVAAVVPADEHSMENFGRFGLDQTSVDGNHTMQWIESYPPTPGWTGSERFYQQWNACA